MTLSRSRQDWFRLTVSCTRQQDLVTKVSLPCSSVWDWMMRELLSCAVQTVLDKQVKGGVARTSWKCLSQCQKASSPKTTPIRLGHERAQQGQNIAQIYIQFVFVNSKNWTVRLPLQDVTAVIEECMEDGVPWFDSTRLKTWDTSGRSGRYVQSTVMSQLTRFQSFKGQFLKRSLVRSQIVNW